MKLTVTLDTDTVLYACNSTIGAEVMENFLSNSLPLSSARELYVEQQGREARYPLEDDHARARFNNLFHEMIMTAIRKAQKEAK